MEIHIMIHNHSDLLNKVKTDLPADELLSDLFALSESEMCVCAIAELLGMNQSAISHQLRTLKDANLVASRREGKTIYYHLSDDHVRTIIGQGFEHLTEKH